MDVKVLTKPLTWCTSAQIFAVLAIFTLLWIVFGKAKRTMPVNDKVMLTVWEACRMFLILCIMLYACSKGYEWVSWVILAIPFILALIKLSGCPKDLKKENYGETCSQKYF